jgi:serine/threonine protein kinase
MNTVRNCPSCRKPLPTDAPEGLCPECLVKVGLATQPSGGTPSTAPTLPSPAVGINYNDPPPLADVARLFPQLEILELLGQGGMGVVYKARQKQLDRLVALKIMLPQFSRDPAFVERFNREARTLARLNHPNIVAVHDFGQTASPQTPDAIPQTPLCFFIMEFVDGANLRHLIQSGALKPGEALAIVPKICEALQFAHDEGVVHRDIKPANILIDKKGRVKIADFGLAKLAGSTDFSLTRSQQGMGTPHYMAPEQL